MVSSSCTFPFLAAGHACFLSVCSLKASGFRFGVLGGAGSHRCLQPVAVLESRAGDGGGTAVPHQRLRVTAMPTALWGPGYGEPEVRDPRQPVMGSLQEPLLKETPAFGVCTHPRALLFCVRLEKRVPGGISRAAPGFLRTCLGPDRQLCAWRCSVLR